MSSSPPPPPPSSPSSSVESSSTLPSSGVSSRPCRIFRQDLKVDNWNQVTDLRCAEVRWFYRKTATEKWTPLGGEDSLLVEADYRRKHDIEIESEVHAELAKRAATPKVVVLDRLYRVADDYTHVEALYWKGDTIELRRGTWFAADTMQPLEPQVADRVDAHHLEHFRGQPQPEHNTMFFADKDSSKKPVLAELSVADQQEVVWNSIVDVTLNSGTRNKLFRWWSRSTPLRRGFDTEAEWKDAAPQVSHLILVVHGIGQKGYENLIAKNTEQIRDCVGQVMERQMAEERTRPVILPVEWRAALSLDSGLTDHLTLPRMAAMRYALNATAMDIMYYQSPLYRQEIVGGVLRAMNEVYRRFIDFNPTYKGPVSVYAHSLGSVICYDILTDWSPLQLFDQYVEAALTKHVSLLAADSPEALALRQLGEAREKLINTVEGGMSALLHNKDEQLLFRVENLFCVGSPLGVFLVMRGATRESLIPRRRRVGRIYNIFHPYDPVAFRLEPLFHPDWKHIRPVKLFASSDPRACKPYGDVANDVHKSYLRKLKAEKKQKDKDKDKEGKEQKDAAASVNIKSEEELEEDDDYSDDDARSGYSSPRSESPPPANSPQQSVDSAQTASRSWWKFGGAATTTTTTATAAATSTPEKSSSKKQKEAAVEVAKEAAQATVADGASAVAPGGGALSEADKLVATMQWEERVPQRLDFHVQPALTDKSYWSLIKSHFSYWTNFDLAAFLVNQIYVEANQRTPIAPVPEERPGDEQQQQQQQNQEKASL